MLPALDCHAHISPEVTQPDLDRLGDAIVFAVTRSLEESERVQNRSDRGLIWGCGVHPGSSGLRSAFSQARFRRVAQQFVLIGEVGLDKKAGDLERQVSVFRQVLEVAAERPTLCSIHSAGCADLVLEIIGQCRPSAPILHWFTGESSHVERAVTLGCWFSVNARMKDDMLRRIPAERVLPETDFPFTRRSGVQTPGDIGALEERLARLWRTDVGAVRILWYRNLRRLIGQADLIDQVPDELWDRLVSV